MCEHRSRGFKVEKQFFKEALDILTEDSNSLVAGYIWTSNPDATAAERRLDAAGIDFLVKLSGMPFIYFPLQVKSKSTKKSSKGLRDGDILEEHYHTYPYVFAVGLDDQSVNELVTYLDQVIAAFVNGESIHIPGWPDD